MKLIPVKMTHIADGIGNDCLRCPVALALQAAGFDDAEVWTNETIWRTGAAWFLNSDEVRWWIDDYDEWDPGTVAPVATPQPVTLVLDDNRLLTLSEWQAGVRGQG